MFSPGVLFGATVPAPAFPSLLTPIADLKQDGTINPEELTQRNKLAALYRLVDLFRWSQGIYNHITVSLEMRSTELLNV